MGPVCQTLPGNRLHLQHGPIDLIIQAEGESSAVERAHQQATLRFADVLPVLVTELRQLRQPVDPDISNPMQGPVARLMWQACQPFARSTFVTPMAAVAGSVARYMLVPYQIDGIDRAWVNNGGDIAIHLTGEARLRLGLFSDLSAALTATLTSRPSPLDATATLCAADGIGGVATSGWAGRSHSLGIADSVTVFAANASLADVAATLLANAVNVDDASIMRQPASLLSDDTDLRDYLVTVDVPKLAPETVALALARGLASAQGHVNSGLLHSVVLVCQGQVVSANRMTANLGEKRLCHPL